MTQEIYPGVNPAVPDVPVMNTETKYVTGVALPPETPGLNTADKFVIPDTYTTEKGVKLKLKAVEAMKIKMIQDSCQLPEHPTYTVTTPAGRTQTFKLDEVSAKANPQDEARYRTYLEDLEKTLQDQNLRVTRAIMFYGTELVTPLPDDGWDEMQMLNGIDVPKHPEMKRAHYLVTELSNKDLQVLLRLIMSKSGVTEEEVSHAEGMFRR